MKRRKLFLALVVVFAFVVAALTTGTLSAYDENSAAMVPDCDCTIHNYPKPGDTLHGKRDEKGECFATPCATEVEVE